MKIFWAIVFFLPYGSFASEQINCHFGRFHQENHDDPEMSGYAVIDQTIEIVKGKTSEGTLKLDGAKRGTNSIDWVRLGRDVRETYSTHFAGDFGDLLTIEHELGNNLKSLNGRFKASLVNSRVRVTTTRLGECFIK